MYAIPHIHAVADISALYILSTYKVVRKEMLIF